MSKPKAMYSKEDRTRLINLICDEVAKGKAVRNVLKMEGMPDAKSFYEWIDNNEDYLQQYARATEARAEAKFDSIEADYMAEPERDKETGKIDPGWVNLQRLKIDSKKFEVSKLFPKKYGDKQQIEHSGGFKIESVTFE